MRDIYRISKFYCGKYIALTYYNVMRTKKVNTELKERMLKICSELGISPNKLSEESGMSREYIRLNLFLLFSSRQKTFVTQICVIFIAFQSFIAVNISH